MPGEVRLETLEEKPEPTSTEVSNRKINRPKTQTDKLTLLKKRTPKSPAVIIDRPSSSCSIVAVIKRVLHSIKLTEMGIHVKTTRMTRAGGILLEVEDISHATLLTEKLRSIIGEDARVRLLKSLTPILILNIPEWTTAEDVIDGLLKAGITPQMILVKFPYGRTPEAVERLW